MASDQLSPGDFGAAFKGFLEQAVTTTPTPEPFFRAALTDHFDTAPSKLPIVAEQFQTHEHANLQLALDDYVAGEGRHSRLLGVSSEHKRMMGLSMGDLVASVRPGLMGGGGPQQGPVDYLNRASGLDEKIACVQYGLYLVEEGDARLAVFVRGADSRFGQQTITVEAMAPTRDRAEAFLADIRTRLRKRNVYRGNVVSLAARQNGIEVDFHHLPSIGREDIVLPAGVLERIERQTIRFAELRERLTAAGRHLRRGILLWGPPGTGKTLTAMYLAGRMPDRTVILLTGKSLGLIETSCRMARLLQPTTVIPEDVDLVAEERTRQSTGTNAVLFELLNQMDGLAEDLDVLFVLTTNRPELLEPALASRPGRVDEAIEVPLPDAASRDRLLELYGRGLDLDLVDRGKVVERTEGVSAAFIKELLRKAALIAADSSPGDGITVTDTHLDRALYDLLIEGGELTKALLGVAAPAGRRPSCG